MLHPVSESQLLGPLRLPEESGDGKSALTSRERSCERSKGKVLMAQKWVESGKGSGRSRKRAIIHCLILQQIQVVQHTTNLQHSPSAHMRCLPSLQR
jgi:hypothetical protein